MGKLYRSVLKDQKEVLGPRHRDTLSTAHNLAHLLVKQNKLDEAETLYRSVLKHRDTLLTAHNLAHLLEKQNKLDEAETLYRSVLKDQKEVLGPNHHDTLNTKGNLGHCLMLKNNPL